jgi:hypothetical protein
MQCAAVEHAASDRDVAGSLAQGLEGDRLAQRVSER